MGFNCGIIGLPNVGKSTIFTAVSSATAEAANYPFCTIEPNTGIVPVPDERLNLLGVINKSQNVIPTAVEFVDIAGLVKGASQGEGLGNQFLGHIRSVDALIHVVRCFEDENITHVEGSISPRRDVEVIETELMLSDLASVEKRVDRMAKIVKNADKKTKDEYEILVKCKELLSAGLPARGIESQEFDVKSLGLLTSKPLLYVANVKEDDILEDIPSDLSQISNPHLRELVELARSQNCEVVVISGQVEAEIAQLDGESKTEFLKDLGLKRSGLDRLAIAGYKLLSLITFFTSGPKETKAWTINQGTEAVQAAGEIHSDISKGFIRAEVISYQDYITCKGEQGAKEKGLLRLEGKNYVMKDGDVVHFRFNV